MRACVRARWFDFCVHAQTLVWTAELYHGEKRSAPRFTSDRPSVLSTQRTPVPPVSGPNTPFSVLTLQRVWQDPCQLWLSYCREEKKLKAEQLALLTAAHEDFYVHFLQFPPDKQKGNAINQIKN